MRLFEISSNDHVFAGTFGGFLLSVFSNVFVEDLLRTAILAAVGAGVSFVVSLVLKNLIRRIKR